MKTGRSSVRQFSQIRQSNSGLNSEYHQASWTSERWQRARQKDSTQHLPQRNSRMTRRKLNHERHGTHENSLRSLSKVSVPFRFFRGSIFFPWTQKRTSKLTLSSQPITHKLRTWPDRQTSRLFQEEFVDAASIFDQHSPSIQHFRG